MSLYVAIVRLRRRRRADKVLHDGIEVGRERMASSINVHRGREGLYVKGLFYASFHPILLAGQDRDIVFPEVVAILVRILEHGGFVVTKGVVRGGRMFPESSKQFFLFLPCTHWNRGWS